MSPKGGEGALRAALRLRWRVFLRRHGTPLDALVVVGTVVLAVPAGGALRRAFPIEGGADGAAALVGMVLAAVAGAAAAHRLLYRARELVLLLAQPLDARDLVRLRWVELSGLMLVLGAVLAALVAGGGDGVSVVGAVAAALVTAPLLASSQLLLAWAAQRLVRLRPGAGRALAAGAAIAGAAGTGAALAWPAGAGAAVRAALPVLGSRLLPGGAFVASVEHGDPLGLLVLGAAAAGLSVLTVVLVPRGYGEALDAAAARPVRKRLAVWRLVSVAVWPLPRASGALVRRDVVLLVRGAFPRGALVLSALAIGLLAFREASLDDKLEAWQGELAALMTGGVLATISTFLFAVDFPRVRQTKLVLERVQPVSGRDVLLARWFESAVPGVVLALALAAVASAGAERTAERASEIALSGALLAIACAHFGSAFGMHGEGRGPELAEAAGFPLAAGTLVILGSVALTISPWAALGYPLLYWKAGAAAAHAWESSEVRVGTSQGA